METFQEFLEESSSPERRRGRLSPRGPKKSENSYWGREPQRQVSNLVALRKAGFRGRPSSLSRTQYDDHYHTSSPHHSTNVSTFKSQIDMAVADMEPKKKMSNKGDSVVSTSKRARHARNIRRALGGSRTSKPVHDISIHSDDDIENYSKNDSHKLITRGKSFKRELSGVRDAIIDAGGKPGDIVSATPTALMPGENKRKGAKKRADIYQKEFKTKKPDRKTGLMVGRLSENKSMKTFQEFLQLSERYYEPDERLPSGETPVGKATRKSRTRAKTIGSQSPQNQERWGRQYDLTQTKVKHGADNPELNTRVSHKDKDDVTVHHDERGMQVKHKPSGVYYWVYKSDESPDSHTIEWNHDNDRSKMSRKDRERVGRDAKKVWDQHVSHRLPKGTIVHNSPSASYDNRGREKPLNRRSSIYQRAGFGRLDDEGDQFASVGREPSPKQKAKGKKRLKPLNPTITKANLNWGKDDDDYNEWED